MTTSETYDASKERIVELLRTAEPSTPVAACPGWTVRDLTAHLAGGLADFVASRFAVDEGDDFGERTVRERRGQTIDEALAEWDKNRATADEALAGPMGGVLVAEIMSHEQDLRQALDRPGARDDPGLRTALARPLQELDRKLNEGGGGAAVRLVIDGAEQVVGTGEPVATLTVSSYDLLRVVGGRRTRDQVLALDWSGEPDRALPALTLFGGFRETPLNE
ncbi:MAG TPA: maleylpyruvate isomerase family mycothiol-dependent enzyme [Actinopolymorphaceae bacterium]|nr:maleylpyruvate isomerase family mycothiol-dependent enzyme [Actinopolymorphaceae bacterium]